jgi:hypothetical protein
METRLLPLLTLFCVNYHISSGQSYVTAMGLRMGSDFGVTLQQKIFGHLTAEGIITSSPVTNQTTGTIILEMHNPLLSKRFNFYIGAGLHNRWLRDGEGQSLSRRGVTAVAGAEMTLGRINLAWDYKPVFHLNTQDQPFESETAVSMRYVFVKKIKGSKDKGLFSQSAKKKREKERMKKRKLKEKNKQKKEKSKNPKEKFPKNIFK